MTMEEVNDKFRRKKNQRIVNQKQHNRTEERTEHVQIQKFNKKNKNTHRRCKLYIIILCYHCMIKREEFAHKPPDILCQKTRCVVVVVGVGSNPSVCLFVWTNEFALRTEACIHAHTENRVILVLCQVTPPSDESRKW